MTTARIDRRSFVRVSSCIAGAAALAQLWPHARAEAEAGKLTLGDPTPFRFEDLIREAERRSKAAYEPVPIPRPDVMAQMEYDAHEAIRYRTDQALYPDSPYPVIFRHLGKLFSRPVKMYALSDGQAREVLYDPALFKMPKNSPAHQLPKDAGFAGLSLQTAGHFDPVDKGWLCFLGASYFRGIGENNEMGLSARAVAVNTAPPGAEEFPGYVSFYIERADSEDAPVMLYALLDAPSIAGAYRFTCLRKNGVTMEVDSHLFLREDIQKLGIAPLTSMFWYSEYGRQKHIDWRPEVHDSDALLLWTGKGERVYRALENYKEFTISRFADQNPKGFGLCQRDRDQTHFLDPVLYERRPSLWVEPLDDWGKGHVELVEIPTADEYHDNLVVYWVPKAKSHKGASFRHRYRMHWRNDEPYPTELARVYNTFIGRGGEPATPEPLGVTKYVIEFRGKPLESVRDPKELTADVHVSQGSIVDKRIRRVPDKPYFLLQFDIKPAKPGVAELEARLFLKGKPVSERWRYRMEVSKV